jgi:hypothetical protein
MNGGISQLDFADKNITVWSEKAIEFRNIPCGEDLFESVVIVDADSFISMDFKTSDPKFAVIFLFIPTLLLLKIWLKRV